MKHPYEYLDRENYDTVYQTIQLGMQLQWPPMKIADEINKVTDIPLVVCQGLIAAEFGEALRKASEKK